MLAGIVEFTTATVAVYLAWQRTRPVERPTTRTIRWTGRTLVATYPLLALAYLTDRMGAFVEPVFFVCFSVMVLVELAEPDRDGLATRISALATDTRLAAHGTPGRAAAPETDRRGAPRPCGPGARTAPRLR